MKNKFTTLERNILCNEIAKESERKLELSIDYLYDLFVSFDTLGLNTDRLLSIRDNMNLVLKELEHVKNIAAFGETDDMETDINLIDRLKELDYEGVFNESNKTIKIN